MHVGDADTALHALIDLSFLKEAETALLRFRLFYLFSLQEKSFVCLRVNRLVKERLMISL